MTTHTVKAKLFVPRPLDETFDFFARPENLGRITPDSMGFELRSADRTMRDGLQIEYSIKPLLGIPMTWRSRIQSYDPPNSFEDIQSSGPYKSWRHRHTFTAVDGGTLVQDEVTYELPLWSVGNLANQLVVRHELEWIFEYRTQAIKAILEPAGTTDQPLTVAVAGATGFVGGGIAAELRRRGHRVIGLSHAGGESRGWLPADVEMRDVDAATGDGLPDALAGVDALVIALAFKNLPIESPRRGQTFDRVDAGGTEKLAAAAQQMGVKRLVYMSGAGAAEDAERHWFRAKWRAEQAIRATGIPYTILRPTWIYGPRDVSLNRFLGFARQLLSVPMTNFGRQLLAPVFIDDISRLAADSLVSDAAINQVFEVGGPANLRMDTIINRALHVAGLRRPVIPAPAPLVKLAAATVAWLPSPPLTPDAVDFINQPATVDNKPMLARMPRRLTPLEEGLATYLAHETDTSEVLVAA